MRVKVREIRMAPCATGVVLTLIDAGGLVGRGEASPLAGYSPDTRAACEGVLGALKATHLHPLDLNLPLLPQVRSLVAQLPEALPAARFALETALLDLLGSLMDRSLAHLLADGREPAAAVPLSALLPTNATAKELACAAEEALARGITTLKLKVARPGTSLAVDLRALAHLRREFGEAITLRLDANQGWATAREARDALGALALYAPSFVEEPLPTAALAELGPSPVPLALDESLQESRWRAALPTLAARGDIAAVILKPMALGGALACLELAVQARAFSLGVVVTHLMDGPIARAAAYELARAIGKVLPCGLDRSQVGLIR